MNIKELNNTINEVLKQEAKKLIQEQISDTDHMLNDIKDLQTLSGLLSKISNIDIDGTSNNFHISIDINVTPEELIDCCGGTSLEEAQKNLMQGLHHDLEDKGKGNDFDVDIETNGDENELELKINISKGDHTLLGDNEMKEITKDTNPSVDKKKNIILGGKLEDNEIANKNNKKSNKSILRLNEEQMAELLKKIIKEAAKTMDAITDQAIRDSGKQNAEALKAVEKKIKDYLTFQGNDNPKFPNQIGMGDEKAARQNSKEQDQEVDDNRGRGPQDLDYDTDGIDDNGEPAKKFRDRAKKALVGDSTMGNPSDAANAIKTDVGEKIHKNAERRRENLRKEPIYPKEAVPVKTKTEKEPLRPVNEDIIKEEIEKIKRMSTYNKNTQ